MMDKDAQCLECRAAVMETEAVAGDEAECDIQVWYCHGHAPGPNGWPKVNPYDKCGDFDPRYREKGVSGKVRTFTITVVEQDEE